MNEKLRGLPTSQAYGTSKLGAPKPPASLEEAQEPGELAPSGERLPTDLGALQGRGQGPGSVLLAPGWGERWQDTVLLGQLLGIKPEALPPSVQGMQGGLRATLGRFLEQPGGVEQLQALLRSRFVAKRAKVSFSRLEDVQPGQVRYVEVGRLVPAQLRIALPRVMDKLEGVVESEGLAWSSAQRRFLPQHDEGRSALPMSKAKRAVVGPGGIVVALDGNHQTCASILCEDAVTIPVRLVGDHQDMSMEDFLALAQEERWFYLAELGGQVRAEGLASYAELQDDPYRFLMSSVMLRAQLQGDEISFEASDRLDTRVWTSVLAPGEEKASVDFVEFILADVLYRAVERKDVLERFSAQVGGDLREALALSPKPAHLPKVAEAIRWTLEDAKARGDVDLEKLGVFLNPPDLAARPAPLETIKQAVRAQLER